MLELVDKHGLGPCAERRRGSSPLCGTKRNLVLVILIWKKLKQKRIFLFRHPKKIIVLVILIWKKLKQKRIFLFRHKKNPIIYAFDLVKN